MIFCKFQGEWHATYDALELVALMNLSLQRSKHGGLPLSHVNDSTWPCSAKSTPSGGTKSLDARLAPSRVLEEQLHVLASIPTQLLASPAFY